MGTKKWLRAGALSAALAGITYWKWRQSQEAVLSTPAISENQAYSLLARAAEILRLPTSPGQIPDVLPGGGGLRCPSTGIVYPYKNNVLDLLDNDPSLTFTQEVLNTPFSAWVYDGIRPLLLHLLSLPNFPVEVVAIQEKLQIQPGSTLLDLACGHGNFTAEWAKLAGPNGLVIGLDLSPVMLQRAAFHLHQWGLNNVLLVRGDAQHLPFGDGSLSKVNCTGGFHEFPDLPQVLQEIARVSSPGAILTAATFAEGPGDALAFFKRVLKRAFQLHFVPVTWLGEQLSALGYEEYQWWLPGGWFAYTSAHKADQP